MTSFEQMMKNLQDEAKFLAQARLETSLTKKRDDFIVLNKIASPSEDESCTEDREVQRI